MVNINSCIIKTNSLTNAKTIEKWADCIATKYRQNLPFWITNYYCKKIMLIVLDALKLGRRQEKQYYIRHSLLYLNEDKHLNKHTTYHKNLKLFREKKQKV